MTDWRSHHHKHPHHNGLLSHLVLIFWLPFLFLLLIPTLCLFPFFSLFPNTVRFCIIFFCTLTPCFSFTLPTRWVYVSPISFMLYCLLSIVANLSDGRNGARIDMGPRMYVTDTSPTEFRLYHLDDLVVSWWRKKERKETRRKKGEV